MMQKGISNAAQNDRQILTVIVAIALETIGQRAG